MATTAVGKAQDLIVEVLAATDATDIRNKLNELIDKHNFMVRNLFSNGDQPLDVRVVESNGGRITTRRPTFEEMSKLRESAAAPVFVDADRTHIGERRPPELTQEEMRELTPELLRKLINVLAFWKMTCQC